MGTYLSDEYLRELQARSQQNALLNQPQEPQAPQDGFTPPGSNAASQTPVRKYGDISLEEQIEKFGGPVGSPEYYKKKAEMNVPTQLITRVGGPIAAGAIGGFAVGGPFGMVVGAGLGGGIASNLFPDQETWDKMSTTDKISHLGYRTAEFPFRFATALPAFVLKAVPNLIATVARPIAEKTSPLSETPFQLSYKGLEKLSEAEAERPYSVPGLGELEPFYTNVKREYDGMKEAGYSDALSSVYAYGQAGVGIMNNALVGYEFSKALRGIVRPPQRLAPGETIQETGPIQRAFSEAELKLKREAGIDKSLQANAPSTYHRIDPAVEKSIQKKAGNNGRVFIKMTEAGEDTVEVALVQARGGAIEKTKQFFGFGTEAKTHRSVLGRETKLESHIVKVESAVAKGGPAQEFIKVEPFSAPYKGSENRPITRAQVQNLSNISKLNKYDPAVKDMIVRIMTGKKVVGDLTNLEYFNVAKVLSGSNTFGEFAPGGKASMWSKVVGKTFSPARSWMESVQRKTGIPIYDAWLDLEDGFRMAKVSSDALMQQGREIYGKYALNRFANERKLIDAHMHGDANAITKNASLSPQTKTELLDIVKKTSDFFEQNGEALGIAKEFYKKNEAGYYLPDVMDLEGTVTRYKKGAKIPSTKEFFATKKKVGGDYVRLDDPLQLIDIYARSGSNAKFLGGENGALARAYELQPNIPVEFRDSFRSAVLEKLGYEGEFVRFLDDVSARFANKLNRNIPKDIGRKIHQGTLLYGYTNALNSPGTFIRNELMNNVMLNAKWGGEFWAQAKLKALSREGMEEVRAAGFLNETQQAFGADLGSVTGKMKTASNIVLGPVGYGDSSGRATAYFHTKFHFENAMKLYNTGKISWKQTEKMLDLDGMSPIEAQRIRQALLSGDTKKAFHELARSVIDETNFPYRAGSSARVTFGTAGNLSTFLYKWQIEYTHTLGRWLRTGNLDAMVRYYTSSIIMINSIKEAYGVDFSKTAFLGPLEANYPATIQVGLDMMKVLQTQTTENAELINDAREQLTKNLSTFGKPGGVTAKNWQNFWRSYKQGPDKDGNYYIIGNKGDILESRPVPFSDLWSRLWGLPTEQKVESMKTKRDILNFNTERENARRKVAELRNAGKDDEADNIVLQWEARGVDVEPGNQSYDRFEVPQLERMFDRLDPGGKDIFEERVFPQKR